MTAITLDRHNGDIFWGKKNLMLLAQETAASRNADGSAPKSGHINHDDLLTPAELEKELSYRRRLDEVGTFILNMFTEETGIIPTSVRIEDLPYYINPKSVLHEPATETEFVMNPVGLSGCRAAMLALQEFIDDNDSLFTHLTLASVLFKNSLLQAPNRAAKALRNAIDDMTAGGDSPSSRSKHGGFAHLNSKELDELLEIWIQAETFVRVSDLVLEYASNVGNKTLNALSDTLAEDFLEMSSILIQRETRSCLTEIFEERTGHKGGSGNV